LPANRCILVVDQSEETREVLTTALEHRGLRVLTAARADEGLQLAQTQRPDVIVLDEEGLAAGAEELCPTFQQHARQRPHGLVVLGTARRGFDAGRGGEFIRKPYHYAALIRRIEELLDSTARRRPARSA
jgi:DNA-binding response OmpR family regulator